MLRTAGCLFIIIAFMAPLRCEASGPNRRDKFEAVFRGGSLVGLCDGPETLVKGDPAPSSGSRLGTTEGSFETPGREEVTLASGGPQSFKTSLPVAPSRGTASIVQECSIAPDTGDLLVTQVATSDAVSIKSVAWTVEGIPLGMNIIVPGAGGVRLTKDSPEDRYSFPWPMGWEAQLVIVEGSGGGFSVWSDDSANRYKSLVVKRTPQGWTLEFSTENVAPFEGKRECSSVTWRLNTYRGDWRVPAKRYREWAAAAFHLKEAKKSEPAWVKEIRAAIILSYQNGDKLDFLAKSFDPKQTLLYVQDWRNHLFDRNYPDYDARPGVESFIDKAHSFGFRVMLYTNFWGVDAKHPLLKKFSAVQIRSKAPPYEAMVYRNTRQTPPIVVAYINPASKRWREEFIGRVKQVVQTLGADAIHLDQNFHAHNDSNGLIDGQTMLEGVLALHRELREALPNVALGGEGLNELTYRSLSFAQRHVYSAMKGTIDHGALSTAHPISSYLFLPHVKLYFWPGFAAPDEKPQVYNAWRENWRVWGVLPAAKLIRTPLDALATPQGFLRQNLDEIHFWQKEHVEPDMDGEWPDGVLFPYKTSSGQRVIQTKDRALMYGDQEISRTISDVSEVKLPGHIDNWKVYDENRIFGLDPRQWYAYFSEPRDQAAFHVAALQPGFRISEHECAAEDFRAAIVQSGGVVVDFTSSLAEAASGVRLTDGRVEERQGAFSGLGGSLSGAAGTLRMVPPSKRGLSADFESDKVPQAVGIGVTFARFKVRLPEGKRLRFVTEVGLDGRSIGRGMSDGVNFHFQLRDANRLLARQKFYSAAKADIWEVDISNFAGREVKVELSVDPGPENNATEDRAIWYRPRIEEDLSTMEGRIVLANPPDWLAAAAQAKGISVQEKNGQTVLDVPVPGQINLRLEKAAHSENATRK